MSHTKYRQEKNCLNCGTNVEHKFCPQCGQENLELKDNFFHLAFETVGDFFHYDSKFFNSIRPLFIKPGFLTQEYREGRRVRYIQPLRLFFFATILMVIVAGLYYHKFEGLIVKEKISFSDDKKPGKVTQATDVDVKDLDSEQRKAIEKVSTGFSGMFHNLKYISFILVPVYGLIFMFLYRSQKLFYVDHLIYVFHVQAFVYVVLSVFLLVPLYVSSASRDWFGKVVVVIAVVYVALSLRYLYKQSWGKTILKTFAALILCAVVSQLVVLGFFLIGYGLE